MIYDHKISHNLIEILTNQSRHLVVYMRSGSQNHFSAVEGECNLNCYLAMDSSQTEQNREVALMLNELWMLFMNGSV